MNEAQRLLEISRVHLARSSYCAKRGKVAAAKACWDAAHQLWRKAVKSAVTTILFGEPE